MSSEKTTAIVLRVIDFSESSCVVTLFTEEFGKISGLAKGARRPKSAFEAALDLLAVCRIVFIHKSSDSLDLLTEAKLLRRFHAATRDLSRLYAGYYVAELLSDLTDINDPHPELFRLADKTLLELDEGGAPTSLVLRFELVALKFLGHFPSLSCCVDCGCSVEIRGRVAFSQLAGGVMCRKCRVGKQQVVSVSAGVIKLLESYAHMESDSWRHIKIDPQLRGELRSVLNRYLSHLMGRQPRMHRFLGLLSS